MHRLRIASFRVRDPQSESSIPTAPRRLATVRPADVATFGCGCPASNPKPAASCRSRPRRASCPSLSQASAATEPVCPTSSCVTVRVVKSQMRMRSSLPAVASVSFVQEQSGVYLGRSSGERHVTPAAREIDDVDHDVVARRGEPLAVGREGQRANPLAARRDVALERAGRHVPQPDLPVAAGDRHPHAIAREGDRPHVGRRAIELLRDLSGRGVDDLKRVREADHRELLAVRMKRNRRRPAFDRSGVSNSRWPVDAFHKQTVRSFEPEASVWPSGEKATVRTQSAWPASSRPTWPESILQIRTAMIVASGGDRLAVGRQGDAGDDRRAAIVVHAAFDDARRFERGGRGRAILTSANQLAATRRGARDPVRQFVRLGLTSCSSRSLAVAGDRDRRARASVQRAQSAKRRHNPSLRVVSTGKAARPKQKSADEHDETTC